MAGFEPYRVEKKSEIGVFGANQSGMRDNNERLVMTILRREGALPKAEIARRTGLSAQTVSVIMRALESDGFLEKGAKVRGKVGQPSVPMALSPGGAYFLGLKVGRRSAEMTLLDFIGNEVAHVTESYAFPTPATTLKFVKHAIDKVCKHLTPQQHKRIAGLGIAVPFFLWEWASIIGVDESAMASWQGFDLQDEVAQFVDFPVFLGNDASCACGAEVVFGTAETPANYLYIYIGHFIGGGVVLNGSLFTGSAGNAGAIGPFPITRTGCKDRQLVDVASLNGLERRLIAAQCDPALMNDPNYWNFDQDLVEDWLQEASGSIAQAIMGAISVLDFPMVLIDGNMPDSLREKVVERVSEALSKMNLSGLTPPEIAAGSLGPKARPLGAASLPLSKRFMLEA